MTLNFPDTANTGDVFHDSTSGFSYEWNGTVWISTDPQRAANIKELDDISSGFNGSTTQFNLRVSSSAVEPVSDAQLLISVGGVMQNPTNDYTVSGSTITFTTAPSAGLTFFGTFLGQALSLNTVQDGTVEFASFKTGTAGVGIKSDGTAIGLGITQIDFVGSGNTVVSVGNTVSVYIAAGIDTTGTSKFNNITATGDLNVTGNLTYEGVTATNQKIAGVTTTGGLDVLGITSTKDLRSVGITTLTTGSATNFTVTNLVGTGITATNLNTTNATITGIATVTGIIDGNGGANISGGAGLVASSAKISDLTSGRVTYAGGSGELQDSGNLTFSGSELTAASATVSDLTDNRVVIAGSSGALEDSSNLTFDGSTLTVNGDVSVAGTITYQEVSEIDAVGFVTARKGVRVTNGGIIVTAGLSTFSDDVKFAGANYNITFDRSADDLIFDDNARLAVGSGSDYQLYHDGTYTWALDSSTGGLHQQSTKFVWQSRDDSENMAIFHEDGACRFFFNGTERVSTTSVGVNVVGNVDCDSLNNAGISTFTGAVTTGDLTVLDPTPDLKLQDSNHTGNNTEHTILFKDSTGANQMNIGSPSGEQHLRIKHNTTDLVKIQTDGKVGINETSPDNMLHVRNDNSAAAKIGGEGGSAYYMEIGQLANSGSPGFNATGSTTSMLFQLNGSEKARLDSSGRLLIGTTTEGNASADDLTVATSGDTGITIRSGTSNSGQLYFSDSTSGTGEYDGAVEFSHGNQQMKLYTASTVALTLNSSQNATFAGTVSDSKGNLRSIPIQSNSGSHTLTAASAGKVLYTDANTNVNNSVFSAGDAVTIINNSGSDVTITQGSGLTLYNTADASTGNRTLAGRGMSTIWFASASVAYISGAGLS